MFSCHKLSAPPHVTSVFVVPHYKTHLTVVGSIVKATKHVFLHYVVFFKKKYKNASSTLCELAAYVMTVK
jgi:hypothetical protein